MTAYRLSSGGLVDRSKSVGFRFDGVAYKGFEGDTIASAMMANDQLLLARSFKYHRPRGVVTAGVSEPNALVTIGEGGRMEPNVRATVAELYEGLSAVSQNRWPSLKFDVGSVNSLLSPFLSAGFYYKTFMWPKSFWEKVYEPFIRKAAGLGKLSIGERDPDSYEKSWAFCDLLVIGAGPTGLMAALAAGRAGLKVLIADEGARLGGSLLASRQSIGGESAGDYAQTVAAELANMPNVTVLPRATVFGWFDDMVFGAVERVQKHVAQPHADRAVERVWRIAAKRAVLASGAEERPLVFGGNDLPGVMTASAMRTYANRYGVAAGRKVAVFANGASGYETARDLADKGVEIAAIIDSRVGAADIAPAGARVIAGAQVVDTEGKLRIKGATVERSGYVESIACDALAMSGGWSPIIHLMCHRGQRPVWSEEKAAFLAPSLVEPFFAAGGALALEGLGACLADGWKAGAEAAAAFGLSAPAYAQPDVEGETGEGFTPLWYVTGSKSKAFVDFQNDVHVADLGLALREGYGHVEHAKRYTTNGMATDQGKLSGVNAAAIIAGMQGVTPAQTGTTTFRPFYTPVTFGALAGAARFEHAQPIRTSPLHGWAKKNGAKLVEAGLWYRSAWFPREGETSWRQSCDREVTTVREKAGVCDVSTLGKIEVMGPDAAEFLNRIYSNAMLKLPVGKARYGIMLREDGMVYDDGTVSRFGENHFFITTTTAYAGEVLTHMEFFHQTVWPELDVRFVTVTDQWAQMSVVGPKSREILQELIVDDLSDAAFPFMTARMVKMVDGPEARLYRISFSGELAYELGVPAGYGEAVADAVMAAGAKHGICAYGVEALNVMRIEKGHVTHAELDGRVTADDVGLGKLVSAQKPDFVGKRLLDRYGMKAADRHQLVGLMPVDPKVEFKSGAHILKVGATPSTVADQGWVSSVCYSPALGHMIGLAFVKSGRERMGEKVVVWDKLRGQETEAVISSTVFFDPENKKLHA
ncbi:heterotetrameric sarcosine oxidase alpha subunit [Rhizobium sp. SG_E_25_P2]|uniref:sarcosine oxidase subunit alpha family protein n=1 Tax=Rhizobium sp. SG_E_25_P2 TaxID=2879942 RepID=UPI0024750F1E|nr:sarcosine oxidase subunit alpha family protein [Rhizobium sp. SG_E_25_P2]MDH6269632.1 heterotetrameric sarcosine oxidase alpha subunit [Rhizobium sp. SG_E_25_P2]